MDFLKEDLSFAHSGSSSEVNDEALVVLRMVRVTVKSAVGVKGPGLRGLPVSACSWPQVSLRAGCTLTLGRGGDRKSAPAPPLGNPIACEQNVNQSDKQRTADEVGRHDGLEILQGHLAIAWIAS